jgi:hypothetical protein
VRETTPKPQDNPYEGEGRSVEERRTETEAHGEPPPERERPVVEAKDSLQERRRTLDGGCDPQTPGQPLKEGKDKPPIEKERGDKVAQQCRTMPQRGLDNAAECDRNADVCNSRHSTSDETVTSQPGPRRAKETPREAEKPGRELSGAGRSSDPPGQPQ